MRFFTAFDISKLFSIPFSDLFFFFLLKTLKCGISKHKYSLVILHPVRRWE